MKETERLFVAAQDQALRTNVIKKRIDKTRKDSKRRMCQEEEETITHIIWQCRKLVQKKYEIRYDNVVRILQWELCGKNGLYREAR